MVAPVAGSTPITKPTPVPRRIGRRQARQSARVGSTFFTSATGRVSAERAARDDLAHAEERDGEDDELDAVEEPGLAEVEARNAVLRVDADRADEKPGDARDQSFEHGRTDRRQAGEPEHDQREVLRRPERERGLRERRREQHQPEGAERAGDERADRRDAERRAGAALQRELVAVDASSSPCSTRRARSPAPRSACRRIASRSRCRRKG